MMSNRLFEKLGKPFNPARKAAKKSTSAMLRDAIAIQKEIAQGKQKLTPKGTQIKPWFDKKTERFTPKIGIARLYGEEGSFKYTPGEEIEVLDLLEDMLDKGELDEQLKPFKEKRGI